MSLRVQGIDVEIAGTRVLTDVDLTIAPGELLALVGPNGAGKTTLLNVLAGDLAPRSGSVELDGRPVSGIRVRDLARRRAVLPQEQRLAFGFRVVDVVRMGRAPWTGTDAEDRDDEVVAAAMGRTDVLHLADRIYPTLSGGEKSRASLARVISQETEIVLLDEPTAALDPQARRNLWDVLRGINDSGRTVVLTTHYMEEAEELCDRVAIVDHGRLLEIDTPGELIRQLDAATRIGLAAEAITVEDARALPGADSVTAGGSGVVIETRAPATVLAELGRREALEGLSVSKGTLEDVFLDLTGREYRA